MSASCLFSNDNNSGLDKSQWGSGMRSLFLGERDFSAQLQGVNITNTYSSSSVVRGQG